MTTPPTLLINLFKKTLIADGIEHFFHEKRGNKLLYAMASIIARYITIDPNTKLHIRGSKRQEVFLFNQISKKLATNITQHHRPKL